jgi:hypothetical protein
MYQISSKTGIWHVVEADMPDGPAALNMWRGIDLPATKCGRTLEPVNFFEPAEKPYTQRCGCSRCYA